MKVLHMNRVAPTVAVLSMVGSWLYSSHGLRAMEAPVLLPATVLEQAPSSEGNRCAGSDDTLGRVYLVPDAVVTGAGGSGSRIQYHAEIQLKNSSGGIAWTAEVVDDRGRVVQQGIVQGSASSGAGQTTQTPRFSPMLSDGYYALSVRAAVVTREQAADVLEARQYVRVQNGAWTELTDSQWRQYSRAAYAYGPGARR